MPHNLLKSVFVPLSAGWKWWALQFAESLRALAGLPVSI